MNPDHFKSLLFTLILAVALAACSASSATQAEEEASAAESNEQAVSSSVVETENLAGPSTGETSKNLLAGTAPVTVDRDPDVPPLPFPDNPDPALCGIPRQWSSDEPAYLSGIYENELIQPIVFLYDSHLRRKVVAQAPHGSRVKILLSQSNPELDYFMVKVIGAEPPNEGWVPAPFVSFEPPPQL
ncbi:MAG: hypothetical protein R3264_21620 [Anaerolineae bacterium]|nr:hypothetical protein [Anaerolineae bacterium]